MRVLVTGGAGFIGRNLAALLLSEGHGVTLADTVTPEGLSDDPSTAKGVHVPVDLLRDDKALRCLARGHDAVVHLAAATGVPASLKDPQETVVQNVGGALNTLEACRMGLVPRFVLASTGAAAACTNPYGASKRACEAIAQSYAASFGLETVSLRFSNIYGPNSAGKGSVVSTMIRRVLAGKPLTIEGSGDQARDFIHVTDVCRAIVAALEAEASKVAGQTFAIGSGVQTSINTLVSRLTDIHDGPVELCRGEARGGGSAPPVDITPAMDALDWLPGFTLLEGLEDTYRWFKGQEEVAP